MTPSHGSITQLLDAWHHGDAHAADALFAIVYDDLRMLARRQLAALHAGQTLAPTALVHEAYMKFAERSAPDLVDRSLDAQRFVDGLHAHTFTDIGTGWGPRLLTGIATSASLLAPRCRRHATVRRPAGDRNMAPCVPD